MPRSSLLLVLLCGCAHAQVTSRDDAGSLRWTYAEDVAPDRVLQAKGLYMPDPSIEQIVQARKSTIEAPVRFCVNARGRTERVVIERPTNDARLDAALRAAIAKWRFKPAIFAGQPVQACTTATFVVVFR